MLYFILGILIIFLNEILDWKPNCIIKPYSYICSEEPEKDKNSIILKFKYYPKDLIFVLKIDINGNFTYMAEEDNYKTYSLPDDLYSTGFPNKISICKRGQSIKYSQNNEELKKLFKSIYFTTLYVKGNNLNTVFSNYNILNLDIHIYDSKGFETANFEGYYFPHNLYLIFKKIFYEIGIHFPYNENLFLEELKKINNKRNNKQ